MGAGGETRRHPFCFPSRRTRHARPPPRRRRAARPRPGALARPAQVGRARHDGPPRRARPVRRPRRRRTGGLHQRLLRHRRRERLRGCPRRRPRGAAVYLWHCNREGEYSLYSEAIASENYLRGVQEAGKDGSLEFTSIFPAAYDGRWPHIHFEVYASLDDATGATNKLRTSQIALPEDICNRVYATEGYEASVANLAATSLSSDMVFADGHSLQLATVTGSVDAGYVASLNVPV
jgi:hypothetical protein